MKYSIGDVRHLIPETLTEKQAQGIEAYLNEGTIPPADPCQGCEPNLIRKYINRVQKAEREGQWPPFRASLNEAGDLDASKIVAVVDEAPDLTEDITAEGYTRGILLGSTDEPEETPKEKPKAAPRKRRK